MNAFSLFGNEPFCRRDLRSIETPAVDKRAVRGEQLDRGDQQVVAFAQQIANLPFAVSEHSSGLAARVHTGLGSESRRRQRRFERIKTESCAQLCEEVIARITQRLGEVERRFALGMRTDNIETITAESPRTEYS